MSTGIKHLTLKNLGIIALAVAAAPLVNALEIVSVNLRDGGTTANNSYVTTAFGIPAEGTVVGWWTNTNSFGSAFPTTLLRNSKGIATTVSATVRNAGGQQYWGATYAGTPWNYGIAKFTATVNEVSVTIDNLNANFPDGYFAIVYVNGPTATTGASVTDGTTTYYFKPSNPASTTPILITDTNPGDGYQVGNYAKFGSLSSLLTANSITFAVPVPASNHAGIGGVQIVGPSRPAITNAAINGSNQFVLDFTGEPSTNYEVKKSSTLAGFVSLSTPLIQATDANGVGQMVVPASEMAGAKQFFVLEKAP